MQNQLNDSISSVGCVICSMNFTSDDDTNVVTTCGHLYHKKCLIKWFASAKDLNGHNSCPDCRTYINDKNGIKSVYLHFMSDDESDAKASELVRVQDENLKLVQQLSSIEYEMKILAKTLKTERAKNTRLANKVGELLTKMKNAKNTEKSPKKYAVKKVCNGEMVTKELRNRNCTYQI